MLKWRVPNVKMDVECRWKSIKSPFGCFLMVWKVFNIVKAECCFFLKQQGLSLSAPTLQSCLLFTTPGWQIQPAIKQHARGEEKKKTLCKSQRRHDKQSGSQMLSAWCLTVHRCSLLFPALVFIRFISRSFSSLMDQRSDLRAGKTHAFIVYLHFTPTRCMFFIEEYTLQVGPRTHMYEIKTALVLKQ